MSIPEQEQTRRAMLARVNEALASSRVRDSALPPALTLDATRVAREAGGCLYRISQPATVSLADLEEDTPGRLAAGGRQVTGLLGPLAEDRRLLETDVDLGPRVVNGRLVVDRTAPLRALRDRLTALAPRAGAPAAFRFDQAALALGPPGERPREGDSPRSADAFSRALRDHWAVEPSPGSDAAGLLVPLLDAFLRYEASVLVVAPSGAEVDRILGALCERLAGAGRLRSGLVQRVGLLAPGPVRDRWGPYVQAASIAADLRAGLDERLGALDRLDGRLRFDEAERRVAELDRHAADINSRLGRTVSARPGRRRDDPDELLVRLHSLRAQRRSARQAADRIAMELSRGGRVPRAEELLGEGPRRPADRRRQLADAREELLASRARIDAALRRRCRLVATTTRSAYSRELPRTSFDVVVIVGRASDPEAYYLGGLSSRSVLAVPDDAPVQDPVPLLARPRPAPHADSGFHRRLRADRLGAHRPLPAWRRNRP